MDRIIRTANPNGRDVPSPIYGNGLINAAAAVTADLPASTSPTPAAQLAEWIRIHRRAEAEVPEPAPAPNVPEPVAPKEDPPLPAQDASAAWLPHQLPLTYITVPLAVLVGFGILGTLFGIGATRRFKRTSRVQ